MSTQRSRAFVTGCGFAIAAVLGVAACGDLSGAPKHPGRKVYTDLRCGKCHGDDLAGTRTAPGLTAVSRQWQQDSLVAYLKDPQQVTRSTPHIAYRNEAYPLKMPRFGHVDEERLIELSQYLLSQ